MELVTNTAELIIAKHVELEQMQIGSLEIAISIGELLNDTKGGLDHGDFTPWIQQNLPFSMRTAQKYMQVFYRKDEFHKLGKNELTEAYLLISPDKEKETGTHIHNNPVHTAEGENEEIDVTPIETGTEAHSQKTYLDYWDHLGPLIEKMDQVWERLKGLRNSTTPEALGHMFGNIRDMADTLESWSPKNLELCPLCSGKNEGKSCGVCLSGEIGNYMESRF